MTSSVGDKEMVKNYETLSLSEQTESRRMKDMGGEVPGYLKVFRKHMNFTL